MAIATGSNLYSNTWSTINAVISGNVLDPILSTRAQNQTGSTFIFGAFPDMEGRTRPIFPVIVLDNPAAESTPATFANGQVQKNLSMSAWVYSKSNLQLNTLADDVTDAILSNRATFEVSGLQVKGVDDGAQGTDIQGNQRIHYKELRFMLNTTVL